MFMQWNAAAAGGEFYLRPELNYRGGFRNIVAPANHALAFGDAIPARSLWNARAGYSRGRISCSVSAENLFSKAYFTGFQESVSGRRVDVHPRTLLFRLQLATD